MVSLMPADCTNYLQSIFGIKYQHLSSQEQIILSTAFLEEKISNARLQSVLGMHATDVGRLLYGLVQYNMLISEQRGRWTTYSINKDFVPEPEQLELSDISIADIELNKTDQQIYQFVKANHMITTQQVVDMIDTIATLQGASVAINRLIEKGLLRKDREGRHIFYCLK